LSIHYFTSAWLIESNPAPQAAA